MSDKKNKENNSHNKHTSDETNIAKNYDDAVYATSIFGSTHPALLQTFATLFGMNPKPCEKCTVLELGCSTGDNTLFFASLFPESRFVGMDLSEVAIKNANHVKEQLGLRNVEFLHKSITDIDQGLGKFDYIIAHGVFSWVPKNVQDAILRVFKENLAEQGVAYVSYNALPGWNMVRALRDVMMYHTRNIHDFEHKVDQGIAVLSLLRESMAGTALAQTPYGHMLESEIQLLDGKPKNYFGHDHLAEVNDPWHFYQMIEACEQHGLQYLSEAELATMYLQNMPKPTIDALQNVTDVRQLMQYIYFVRGTRFATNLFTHASCTINRALDVQKISNLNFFTDYLPLQSVTGVAIDREKILGQEEMQFRGPAGAEVRVSHPIVKAVLICLGQDNARPQPFAELVRNTSALLSSEYTNVLNPIDAQIQAVILQMLCGGTIKCSVYTFTRKQFDDTAKPKLTKIARYLIDQKGMCASPLATLQLLNDLDRIIALLCDGNNDIKSLENKLYELYQNGHIQVQNNNESVELSESEIRQKLMQQIVAVFMRLHALCCFE